MRSLTPPAAGVFAGGDAQDRSVGGHRCGGPRQGSRHFHLPLSQGAKTSKAGREPLNFPRRISFPSPKTRRRRRAPTWRPCRWTERKTGFAEVEKGLTEEQARAEASTMPQLHGLLRMPPVRVRHARRMPWTTAEGEGPATIEVGSVILAPGFKPSIPRFTNLRLRQATPMW